MNSDMDKKPKEKMGRRILKGIWGILPVAVLIIIIIFLGVSIGAKQKATKAERMSTMKKEPPPINVVTMVTTPRMIQDKINLPGIIEPWVRLKVLAEVRGRVTKKVIALGDVVKKGELIAVIDPRDYQNHLKSARANYDSALASRKRLEKMYKERLTTRSQLDSAIAMVETSQAQMDTAALNLGRCEIKAPISGIVNTLYFEQGEYLNVGQPVAEVLQLDKVKVVIGIPESDVNAVRKVDDYRVQIDALGGKQFQAKKHFLSKSTDPMARLYGLEIVIDNPLGELLPDMFARVEIVKQQIDDAITLPLYSVISMNSQHRVYVVRDGVVQSKKVELGLQEGWRVEIAKGLDTDEHVVVVGQRGLNDGQKVKTIRSVSDMEELAK